MTSRPGPGAKREIWKLDAFIEATSEQANDALEAIGRALCPDDDHPVYCPVPWVTMIIRFADLDDEEKASWQQEFDDDRRRAREAGTEGA